MVESEPPDDQGSKEEAKSSPDALATLKAEVDNLQVHILGLRKPWYQEIATLISVAAFLVSLATTVTSELRLQYEENLAARAELRQLILRLNSLPRENFEFNMKYKNTNDSMMAGNLSSLFNSENLMLAKQAREIAYNISDLITATEYLALATAFSSSGDFNSSYEVSQEAIAKLEEEARAGRGNVIDLVTAYRALGASALRAGRSQEGHEYYKKAIDIVDQLPSADEVFKRHTLFFTEMFWSQELLIVGDCSGFQSHVTLASTHLERIPPHPAKQALKDQLAQAGTLSAGCKQGMPASRPEKAVRPTGGTLPLGVPLVPDLKPEINQVEPSVLPNR